MAKFCKLFENEEGEQLLLLLSPSDEDDRADFAIIFEMKGATVKITLGSLDWDKAQKNLEEYEEETALEILEDPEAFVLGLIE